MEIAKIGMGSNLFYKYIYLDKTIMEKETDSSGNSDKSLLEFGPHCIPNNRLDIGAGIGVEIFFELSR